jgi:glycosyltransferase involved in cell wall biosynthesis
VVLTYHSPNYEHAKWNSVARSILKISERIALAAARHIIFVSSVQRKKFDKKALSKSSYIPNGIRKPSFDKATDRLQELGLVAGKYILAVGRITPEKGFEDLIRAFEKANFDGYYQLVIAGGVEGENAYFSRLRRLASKNVIFTGHVYGATLAQLYTHAGLFVLPSYNEGMPLVLLEAMSYGLPVMASDIPANRAVNLPADCYFHLDSRVVASLSDALQNKLPTLSRRSYDLSPYDWNAIATQTAKTYMAVSGEL